MINQAGVEYLFPESVDDAIRLLESNAGQAQIIAGGTDVLPDIRRGRIRPRLLVDITRIPGLDRITVTSDHVEIGAAVTFSALKHSPFINDRVHALADAARCVGAGAIQNVATWVGNLVQAMPAADGAIVALALDAEARVADDNGATWRPVESLFLGPGISAIDPTRQLVSHLRFPVRWERVPDRAVLWGTAFVRIGRRPSVVLPILNCAVCVCLDASGERIEQARLALGPVAPRPFRARQVETYLEGRPPGHETFAEAAQLVRGLAEPRDSVMRASRTYRLAIIPPLVESTLQSAAQHALGQYKEC